MILSFNDTHQEDVVSLSIMDDGILEDSEMFVVIMRPLSNYSNLELDGPKNIIIFDNDGIL